MFYGNALKRKQTKLREVEKKELSRKQANTIHKKNYVAMCKIKIKLKREREREFGSSKEGRQKLSCVGEVRMKLVVRHKLEQ
jgi:hypothetical protein